jgi:hypothetical protein
MMPDPTTILTPLQIRALSELGRIAESAPFYLSGASALSAFYLGHRRSGDLDLFTSERPLVRPVSERLWTALKGAGVGVQVVRSFESFAEAVLQTDREQTRVQFAQDSPFRLEPPALRFEGVAVDTLADLAANKLLALYGRAEPRDFVDVYEIVRRGLFEMDRLIDLSGRKDPGLDRYFLALAFQKAAALPDDPGKLPVAPLSPIDLAGLKRYFEQQALRFLKRDLPGP